MSARDVLARPPGPVVEAARRLADVERAVARLSRLDSVARLVSAAPREACRALGLPRAMVSHLRGDRISFASVSVAGDPVQAADFARVARAVRPRLDRCAPEHEAVVRQAPLLVADVRAAAGVFAPLVRVARTTGYVVAPIVCDGQAVALLHADGAGLDRALDELDRELLWTVATGIGWAMDGIDGRAPGGEPALGGVELEAELTRTGGLPDVLTAQEREVLERAAAGGAGEPRLPAILGKLGAANRTEAVSLVVAQRRAA